MNNLELACLYHDLRNEMTPSVKRFIEKFQKEYSEEIERLKESEEYYKKGFRELYKRIEEAIEYIEKRQKNKYSTRLFEVENDLLNILKGE